ncbi:MAG: tetratricopeptide repeat protein [Poseidonia sp.]
MSAESHYLNALEALEEGDRDLAKTEAKKATSLDPDHLEAWSIYVEACLPPAPTPPTMAQAAQALSAVKKIVAADPSRMDMWIRGGRLMSDDLGMLHDSLHWWQSCRDVAPDEVTPVVEMASTLADMGEYSLAQERLQSILDDNMDVGMTQFRKINSLLQLVRTAATQQERDIFKPYERHHDGWIAIRNKMVKPPMSQNFIFLITALPILFILIILLQGMSPESFNIVTLCFNTLAILIVILVCARNAKRWFQIINRPAFNLLRAMNFEAATGYTVMDEEIRTSVLYMYIMQRKPLAWQERMLKIIDKGTPLPNNWRLRLPDFASHVDSEGFIPIEEGPLLDAYEEE